MFDETVWVAIDKDGQRGKGKGIIMIYRLWDKLDGQYVEDLYGDILRVSHNGVPEYLDLQDGTWKDASQRVEVEWGGNLNGLKVYDGDIIKYYEYDWYIQQSLEGMLPEIDKAILVKHITMVGFHNGIVGIGYESDVWEYSLPIAYVGINETLEEVKKTIFGDDYAERYQPDEVETDMFGVNITKEVLGIEVIGNVRFNPELLEEK